MEARNALVEANLGLVKYVVKRFANRGADYDDLYQCGCMGLLKAIDRFDPSYPVQFSTYAVPVVMGEIRRYLRDDGPVHVSRTIREQAKRVRAYCDDCASKYGRSPDVREIADQLGMSPEETLLALNSRNPPRSLEEPTGQDGDLRLMDTIGGDDCAEAVDSRLTLSRLLADLTPEDRMLIVRRYFKSHTQTQIARDLGISQVQVSRMEHRILKQMRAAMEV